MTTKNTNGGGQGSLQSMYGEGETTYGKVTPIKASTLTHSHGCKVLGNMLWPLPFTIGFDAALSDMIMVRGCQGTYNIGLEYWLQYGG